MINRHWANTTNPSNDYLKNPLIWLIGCVLVMLALAACTTVQLAGYDQKAYENATTLKPETLSMVTKSGEEGSYASNSDQLDALFVKLESAYEYANGVDNNNEAAANWRDLISDILGSWRDVWKESQQLTPIATEEMSVQIGSAFDTIICLEANKRELTQCE